MGRTWIQHDKRHPSAYVICSSFGAVTLSFLQSPARVYEWTECWQTTPVLRDIFESHHLWLKLNMANVRCQILIHFSMHIAAEFPIVYDQMTLLLWLHRIPLQPELLTRDILLGHSECEFLIKSSGSSPKSMPMKMIPLVDLAFRVGWMNSCIGYY